MVGLWSVLGSALAVGGVLLLVFAGLLALNCLVMVGDSADSCLAAGESSGIGLVNLFEAAVAITGILLTAAGLRFFAARLKDQQRQTEIQTEVLEDQQKQTGSQIRKESDETFRGAIALLGDENASVRAGAIYSLYHLAAGGDGKYRSQIAKILCAHIRTKTRNEEYKTAHAAQPSEEIQAAINVLFRNTKEAEGLYPKFSDDLPQADLHRAYLAGADFKRAKCSNAFFWEADCPRARFLGADCQEAIFGGADCRRADFTGADCQKAVFENSTCQKATFVAADCQEAGFQDTDCQGANFQGADCQKARFWKAKCQGADFTGTKLTGADFKDASTEEAKISDAQRSEASGFGD